MEMNDMGVIDNEGHSEKSMLSLSIVYQSKRHAYICTHFEV